MLSKKRIAIIVFVVIALVLLLLCVRAYKTTGFLQHGSMDKKDLAFWHYGSDGVIPLAEGFSIRGSPESCWILIHGFSSTPDELRQLAYALNIEFNDTIYVPRLLGHGMKPSELDNYTTTDWYAQIEKVQSEKQCDYILGSSMGASLALKYAEEHKDLRGLVIVSTFQSPAGNSMSQEKRIASFTRLTASWFHYLKKSEPGQTVLDPSTKKNHISTFSFPLKGTVELFDFNKPIQANLSKISSPVLFIHSTHDTVASYRAARETFDSINSKKEFIDLTKGDHIVFRDYDREKAISAILEFRQAQGASLEGS